MTDITIISGLQLSDRTCRRLHLSNPRLIKLLGYKYVDKPYPLVSWNDGDVIDVYLYSTTVSNRKARALSKEKSFQVENKTVYWYEEKYHGFRNFILITMANIFLLFLVLLVGYLYVTKEQQNQVSNIEIEEDEIESQGE